MASRPSSDTGDAHLLQPTDGVRKLPLTRPPSSRCARASGRPFRPSVRRQNSARTASRQALRFSGQFRAYSDSATVTAVQTSAGTSRAPGVEVHRGVRRRVSVRRLNVVFPRAENPTIQKNTPSFSVQTPRIRISSCATTGREESHCPAPCTAQLHDRSAHTSLEKTGFEPLRVA